MWSLVLFIVVPFEPLEMMGEIGQYKAFNQCAYAQNTTQPTISSTNPDGLLLCIKDYKNTYGAEQ
jgi:hypothetical protein